jgi:hypothetical protein
MARLIKERNLDEFYVQALLLAEVFRRILRRQGALVLSKKPDIVLKPVVEFRKRMRVAGLPKFEEKTFIAYINFYRDEEDMAKHKALGVLILYIPEIYVVYLFQSLDYPVDDEDDIESIQDACGSLCNQIAGNFRAGLVQLGYQDIAMSHFLASQNDVVDGVEFCLEHTELYELSFYIKNQKRVIMDFNMGPIPAGDVE